MPKLDCQVIWNSPSCHKVSRATLKHQMKNMKLNMSMGIEHLIAAKTFVITAKDKSFSW